MIVGEMDFFLVFGVCYFVLSFYFIFCVRDILYILCCLYLIVDWLDCSVLIIFWFFVFFLDGGGYKRLRKLYGFNVDYEMNRWGFVILYMIVYLGKFLRIEMRYVVNCLYFFNNM